MLCFCPASFFMLVIYFINSWTISLWVILITFYIYPEVLHFLQYVVFKSGFAYCAKKKYYLNLFVYYSGETNSRVCFMNLMESLCFHLAPIPLNNHTLPSPNLPMAQLLHTGCLASQWWCFAYTETDPLCRLGWGQLLFCQWLLTLVRCINWRELLIKL